MHTNNIISLLFKLEESGTTIFIENDKLRYKTEDGLPLKEEILKQIGLYKEEIKTPVDLDNK